MYPKETFKICVEVISMNEWNKDIFAIRCLADIKFLSTWSLAIAFVVQKHEHHLGSCWNCRAVGPLEMYWIRISILTRSEVFVMHITVWEAVSWRLARWLHDTNLPFNQSFSKVVAAYLALYYIAYSLYRFTIDVIIIVKCKNESILI